MRFNVEQQMAKWLKMGTNTMFNYQGIEQADEGQCTLVTPISAARFMLPYWNPFRKDGSLASINDGSWKGQGQNPLEWLENNPSYAPNQEDGSASRSSSDGMSLNVTNTIGYLFPHQLGKIRMKVREFTFRSDMKDIVCLGFPSGGGIAFLLWPSSGLFPVEE